MRVSKSVWRAMCYAFASAALFIAVPASAKVPGKTYCFNGVCHKVKTIAEMVALVGNDQMMKTSFYDDCRRDRFNPCGLTSSGEVFRPGVPDNAASPIYPNGTVLLLRNPLTGDSAVARVNNTGPYYGKRKLDVSKALADKLGFKPRGVADIQVRVLSAPSLQDTKYKKQRRYAPVPGPIGRFASLDQAQQGTMIAMAFNAMSGSLFAPTAGRLAGSAKAAEIRLAEALDASSREPAYNRPAAFTKPSDGLKDAARRTFGNEARGQRRRVPSSLTASASQLVAKKKRSLDRRG